MFLLTCVNVFMCRVLSLLLAVHPSLSRSDPEHKCLCIRTHEQARPHAHAHAHAHGHVRIHMRMDMHMDMHMDMDMDMGMDMDMPCCA